MLTDNVTYLNFGGQQTPPKSVFFERILDLLPDYLFWKNTDSSYLGCNDNFSQLVGLPESNLIVGKTDAELPWRDAEGNPITELGCWDDEVLNHRTIIERHVTLAPANFNTERVRLTKIPLVDEKGNVIGLVGFFKGFEKDSSNCPKTLGDAITAEQNALNRRQPNAVSS